MRGPILVPAMHIVPGVCAGHGAAGMSSVLCTAKTTSKTTPKTTGKTV